MVDVLLRGRPAPAAAKVRVSPMISSVPRSTACAHLVVEACPRAAIVPSGSSVFAHDQQRGRRVGPIDDRGPMLPHQLLSVSPRHAGQLPTSATRCPSRAIEQCASELLAVMVVPSESDRVERSSPGLKQRGGLKG